MIDAGIRIGARVSWTDALGNRRCGSVSDIEENGNVYVVEVRTNSRGRPYCVTRAFVATEIDQLTVDHRSTGMRENP